MIAQDNNAGLYITCLAKFWLSYELPKSEAKKIQTSLFLLLSSGWGQLRVAYQEICSSTIGMQIKTSRQLFGSKFFVYLFHIVILLAYPR